VRGVVTRSGERLEADRVVVCAGAWTPTLLPWLSDRLQATAQPVVYLGTGSPEEFRGRQFPPWAADIANSGWYGFPALDDGRIKIGHHGRGTKVEPDERPPVGAHHVARLRTFLEEAIPALADAPVVGERVCLYCDAFDGDFLIDCDPDRDGLVVATGGSGHGFKFAPVLGGLIADVLEGRPNPWAYRFRWRSVGEARTDAARAGGSPS
jgi:glycine/D-amino acid oxidase-like deaminating enzyme